MNDIGRICRLLILWMIGPLGMEAWGNPQASKAMVPLPQAQFCELPDNLDVSACNWKSITLPHRWEPQAEGLRWALYRFTTVHPGAGLYALVGDRVSMNAYLRATETVRVESPATHHRAEQLTLNRFWPQLIPFALKENQPGAALQLDVMVQGDRITKNGIGYLALGGLTEAQRAHRLELLADVVLALGLASATLMAGLIGLSTAETRTQAGRLLIIFSVLASVAGCRTALSFVVHPPTDLATWTALNLWMLCIIAVLACTGIAVYLSESARRCVGAAAVAVAVISLSLGAAPVHRLYDVAAVLLALLSILGIGLVIALARRVWTARDWLGALLLLGSALFVVFGIHDLVIHLGPSSVADRYFQKWSIPAVVVLTIALMARRVASQRSLEAALLAETSRGQDLIRDLHDGVGSRLVALALYAKTLGNPAKLGEEIQGLIHELQMIQQAVRGGPTQLSSLIADLRHLYTRVGGGQIPLVWDLREGVDTVNLSALQAMATVRILEEAITNAMKHGQPSRVIIRLERSDLERAVVLSVIDDGVGAFQPGPHGGLHNMKHRAAQAGILMELASSPNGKTVKLTFPLEPEKGSSGLLNLLLNPWRRRRAPRGKAES